jgi:hypothetical protein
MDEIEDYTESAHEQSDEHAHHIMHESGGKEKWVIWVALSTAVIAVFAAITGLMAGTSADESILAQMRASDQWAFYQAKGIKADMLNSSNHMLVALGKIPDTADVAKLKREKTEQADIMAKAKEFQKESDKHVAKHEVFSRGVTIFQIAIAIGAISILTKRKSLWIVSLCFAVLGIFFFFQGTLF